MMEAANRLARILGSVPPRLCNISESDAAQRSAPGRWSKKEILGHLIDSAANNHQRFVRAQFANPFVWPGYEQTSWVALHRYRGRSWSELVDLWVALNGHVAAVIESVPADKLSTRCMIGEHEPESLEWWMRDYLRHLKHHLAQLAA